MKHMTEVTSIMPATVGCGQMIITGQLQQCSQIGDMLNANALLQAATTAIQKEFAAR